MSVLHLILGHRLIRGLIRGLGWGDGLRCRSRGIINCGFIVERLYFFKFKRKVKRYNYRVGVGCRFMFFKSHCDYYEERS